MARRLIWVALVLVGVGAVVGANALNTILLGCDYGTVGLGRPLCDSEVGSAYGVLAIAVAVIVVAVGSAVILFRRRDRGPS
ncbi:MAG TPA: hypothetical protein VH371_09410 [Candidatus Limnocylindrales bacterium]|jgi:hypothetical protein